MEETKREAFEGMEQGTVISQPEMLLIGKKTQINSNKGQKDPFVQIREFWAACREDGTLETLRTLSPDAGCYYAACTNFQTRLYDYWIAIEADEDTPIPDGFETLRTEETSYACFPCEGPGLQSVFNRWAWIYREWFVKSNYNHGASPELEMYPFGDMDGADYRAEVRVPVQKVPPMPKRRFTMDAMLLPLVCMLVGIIIGQQLGSLAAGALVGLFVGFLANSITEHKRKNKKDEGKKDE